jgi:methyl-accepting chemotaxis protein
MKQWTIGKKLVLGFSIILVITLALGGFAYYESNHTADQSERMAHQVIPVADGAAEVCSEALDAVFQVRGYFLYENEKYIQDTNKSLEKVQQALQRLDEVAQRENLEQLRAPVAEARKLADQYVVYVNDYFDLFKAYSAGGVEMGKIGNAMSAVLEEFGQGQNQKLLAEQQTGSVALDRVQKCRLYTEMAEETTYIRLNTLYLVKTRSQEKADLALKHLETLAKLVQETEPLIHDPADQKRLEAVKVAIANYRTGVAHLLAIKDKMALNDKQRAPVYNAILSLAKQQLVENMQTANSSSMESYRAANQTKTLMLIGMIVAVAVGSVLAWIIIRSLTRSLIRIATSLAGGSDQVASASQQIAGSSQSLAEGASEQAAAIEETSSSMEEMTSMIRQNNANSGEARNLAGTAREDADRGVESMHRMMSAIDQIKKSSDETGKIVKTIDEIAFQTNLLALNAAVEAARAGEAGKGFAVVAEEVRNLAQRSAEAAKNTATMIEESIKNAENGVTISQEVSEVLEAIAGGSRKVNDLVAEIAAASGEQSQGIEQINTAITQMDTVTQTTAANAEESASASEELNAQAEELNKMVRELRAMVVGREDSQTELAYQHNSRAQSAKSKQRPAALHTSPPKTDTTAADNEKAIPMDQESGMEEF